jgi:hypothetical protein
MIDREKAAFLTGIIFRDEFADDDRCIHQLLNDASHALGFTGRRGNPVLDEVMHEIRAVLAAGGFDDLNEPAPEERN